MYEEIVGRFGTLYLLSKDGNDAVAAYPIDKETITIGRDSPNDIRIYFLWVSRTHCKITWNYEEGTSYIYACSKSGVVVDDHEVHATPDGSGFPLRNGNIIDLGKKSFRFMYPSERPARLPSTGDTESRRCSFRLSVLSAESVFKPDPKRPKEFDYPTLPMDVTAPQPMMPFHSPVRPSAAPSTPSRMPINPFAFLALPRSTPLPATPAKPTRTPEEALNFQVTQSGEDLVAIEEVIEGEEEPDTPGESPRDRLMRRLSVHVSKTDVKDHFYRQGFMTPQPYKLASRKPNVPATAGAVDRRAGPSNSAGSPAFVQLTSPSVRPHPGAASNPPGPSNPPSSNPGVAAAPSTAPAQAAGPSSAPAQPLVAAAGPPTTPAKTQFSMGRPVGSPKKTASVKRSEAPLLKQVLLRNSQRLADPARTVIRTPGANVNAGPVNGGLQRSPSNLVASRGPGARTSATNQTPISIPHLNFGPLHLPGHPVLPHEGEGLDDEAEVMAAVGQDEFDYLFEEPVPGMEARGDTYDDNGDLIAEDDYDAVPMDIDPIGWNDEDHIANSELEAEVARFAASQFDPSLLSTVPPAGPPTMEELQQFSDHAAAFASMSYTDGGLFAREVEELSSAEKLDVEDAPLEVMEGSPFVVGTPIKRPIGPFQTPFQPIRAAPVSRFSLGAAVRDTEPINKRTSLGAPGRVLVNAPPTEDSPVHDTSFNTESDVDSSMSEDEPPRPSLFSIMQELETKTSDEIIRSLYEAPARDLPPPATRRTSGGPTIPAGSRGSGEPLVASSSTLPTSHSLVSIAEELEEDEEDAAALDGLKRKVEVMRRQSVRQSILEAAANAADSDVKNADNEVFKHSDSPPASQQTADLDGSALALAEDPTVIASGSQTPQSNTQPTSRPVPKKTPSFSGIRDLFKPAQSTKTPILAGLKDMFRSRSTEPPTPSFTGVKQMFAPPADQPLTPTLEGIDDMFAIPEDNEVPESASLDAELPDAMETHVEAAGELLDVLDNSDVPQFEVEIREEALSAIMGDAFNMAMDAAVRGTFAEPIADAADVVVQAANDFLEEPLFETAGDVNIETSEEAVLEGEAEPFATADDEPAVESAEEVVIESAEEILVETVEELTAEIAEQTVAEAQADAVTGTRVEVVSTITVDLPASAVEAVPSSAADIEPVAAPAPELAAPEEAPAETGPAQEDEVEEAEEPKPTRPVRSRKPISTTPKVSTARKVGARKGTSKASEPVSAADEQPPVPKRRGRQPSKTQAAPADLEVERPEEDAPAVASEVVAVVEDVSIDAPHEEPSSEEVPIPDASQEQATQEIAPKRRGRPPKPAAKGNAAHEDTKPAARRGKRKAEEPPAETDEEASRPAKATRTVSGRRGKPVSSEKATEVEHDNAEQANAEVEQAPIVEDAVVEVEAVAEEPSIEEPAQNDVSEEQEPEPAVPKRRGRPSKAVTAKEVEVAAIEDNNKPAPRRGKRKAEDVPADQDNDAPPPAKATRTAAGRKAKPSSSAEEEGPAGAVQLRTSPRGKASKAAVTQDVLVDATRPVKPLRRGRAKADTSVEEAVEPVVVEVVDAPAEAKAPAAAPSKIPARRGRGKASEAAPVIEETVEEVVPAAPPAKVARRGRGKAAVEEEPAAVVEDEERIVKPLRKGRSKAVEAPEPAAEVPEVSLPVAKKSTKKGKASGVQSTLPVVQAVVEPEREPEPRIRRAARKVLAPRVDEVVEVSKPNKAKRALPVEEDEDDDPLDTMLAPEAPIGTRRGRSSAAAEKNDERPSPPKRARLTRTNQADPEPEELPSQAKTSRKSVPAKATAAASRTKKSSSKSSEEEPANKENSGMPAKPATTRGRAATAARKAVAVEEPAARPQRATRARK